MLQCEGSKSFFSRRNLFTSTTVFFQPVRRKDYRTHVRNQRTYPPSADPAGGENKRLTHQPFNILLKLLVLVLVPVGRRANLSCSDGTVLVHGCAVSTSPSPGSSARPASEQISRRASQAKPPNLAFLFEESTVVSDEITIDSFRNAKRLL